MKTLHFRRGRNMFWLSLDWENLENIKEQLSVFVPACTGSGLLAQTCSCACSLYSCMRRLVLARVYLFFSLCACRFHLAYVCKLLRMQDSSCACMALGRNLSLGNLAHFSSVFICSAILTSSFTIFALNCMSHVIPYPIMYSISLPHNSFHLIINLIPLSFCRF